MEHSLRKFAILTALAPIVFLGGAIMALFGLWQRIEGIVPVGAVIAIIGVLLGLTSALSFRRARRAFVAEEARMLAGPRSTVRVTGLSQNEDVTINGQHPWTVRAEGFDHLGHHRTFEQTFSFAKPDIRLGQNIDVAFDSSAPEKHLLIIPSLLQEENRALAARPSSKPGGEHGGGTRFGGNHGGDGRLGGEHGGQPSPNDGERSDSKGGGHPSPEGGGHP